MTTRHGLLAGALLGFMVLTIPPARGANAPIAEPGPPVKVMGCAIGPNFNAFMSCLQNQVDGQVDTAVGAARTALEDQVDTLSGELSTAQQQLASSQAQLGQALQQLQTPLVQALTQAQGVELQACLTSHGIDLPQTIAQVSSNPTQFVQGRLTALWQQGMASAAPLVQEHLQALAPGGRPLSVNALIERTDQLFAEMAALDPVAQCAWAMVGPFRNQAKAVAAQVFPALRDQYLAMVDNVVRPAVDQAMVQFLQPMLAQMRQAPGQARDAVRAGTMAAGKVGGDAMRRGTALAAGAVPEDIRKIALGTAHRYLLDARQMELLTVQVNQLAQALRNGNPASRTEALKDLERSMAPLSTFSEQIALEVAMETIRFYGHSLIDTKGQETVTGAFAGLEAGKDGVVELITGVIAVFYEPAEGIGEFVAGCVEVVIDFAVRPAAEKAVITTAHSQFDQLVSQARRALGEGKPPSFYQQQAGPFRPLLASFPLPDELLAIAVPEVGGMRDTLFAYHASVRELSRAAAEVAGAPGKR